MSPAPKPPTRPEGRTDLPPQPADLLGDGLLACTHCGLCLAACPTHAVTKSEAESPRGRLFLMRAVAEGRAEAEAVAPAVESCLGCRACEPACPSGVPYHDALTAFRARRPSSPTRRRLLAVVASPLRLRLFGALLRFLVRSRLARLAQRLGPRRWRRAAAALPRRVFPFRPRPGTRFPAVGERRGTVHLHLGCVHPELLGEDLVDAVKVMTREGWEVVAPKQPSCCGALHAHAGRSAEGAALAAETLDALAGAEAVVSAAAGCAAHLHEHDPRAGVEELFSFLARRGLRAPLGPLPVDRVVHAPPCHLRFVLGEDDATDAVLGRIPGLRVERPEPTPSCCGAGGSAFLEHPELAAAVGAAGRAVGGGGGPRLVVAGNPGCLLQLTAVHAEDPDVVVLHPVRLLRRAQDGAADAGAMERGPDDAG